MATRKRDEVSARSGISFPVIIIVVLWIGLWFLFPTKEAARAYAVTPSVTRIHLHSGSDEPSVAETLLFLGAERIAQAISNAPDEHIQSFGVRPDAPPAFSAPVTELPELLGRESLAEEAARELKTYRPLWDYGRALFSSPANPGFRVSIEGPLGDAGYKAPFPSAAEGWRTNRWWEIVLFVRCDGDGAARDVIIENGTDDARLNREVVRIASQGRCRPTGSNVEGRVRVGWTGN